MRGDPLADGGSEPLEVGFVGTGTMGAPMIRRLRESGRTVHIFNRTISRAEQLAGDGVILERTPRDLSKNVGVVLTMLTDGHAVEAILQGPDGLLAGKPEGLNVIDMGSTHPKHSVALAETVRQAGGVLLDAPVSGTVAAAREGTLLCMAGGDKETIERWRHLLSILASEIVHVGPTGNGSRMKILVNLFLGVTMVALSEVLVFGAAQGMREEEVLAVLERSPSASRALRRKGRAMVTRDFRPQATASLLRKDLSAALDVANEVGVCVPAAAVAHQSFVLAESLGLADMDFASVVLVGRLLAGQAWTDAGKEVGDPNGI